MATKSALVPRSVLKLSFLGVVPACALILGCPKKPNDDGVIVLAMQAFDPDAGPTPQPSAKDGGSPPQPNAPDTDGIIVLAMVAFDADPQPKNVPDAKKGK